MTRILKREGYMLVTVPFGIPKVVGASHRVYDAAGIGRLAQGLTTVKSQFYTKNDDGYWTLCKDSKCSSLQEDAVACLVLSKARITPVDGERAVEYAQKF